ncbi:MAG TPA: galactokinase family protein [Streptosporangiaceae bacterium]
MRAAESEAGATQRFKELYGAEPAGIWQAPGRVNLIGEHTDYNDGFALPFAISTGISVAAAPRDDGRLVLTSYQEGPEAVEVPLAGLAPGAVTGWVAYPAGVAWSLRDAGYPIGGLNIAIDADLALGAGWSRRASGSTCLGASVRRSG